MRVWNPNLSLLLAHEAVLPAGDRAFPAEFTKTSDQILQGRLVGESHPRRPSELVAKSA